MSHDEWLLPTRRKGKGVIHARIATIAAEERAKAAKAAVDRAGPAGKLDAEIKAQRARKQADEADPFAVAAAAIERAMIRSRRS